MTFIGFIFLSILDPSTTVSQKTEIVSSEYQKNQQQPTYKKTETRVQKSNSLSNEDDGWVWMRASYLDRISLSNDMAESATNEGVKVSGEYLEGCITGFYTEAKYGGKTINVQSMSHKIYVVSVLCSMS